MGRLIMSDAADHRVLFTALGFLAVVLNDVPQDKQALRARALAKLIEEFCAGELPEYFYGEPHGKINQI